MWRGRSLTLSLLLSFRISGLGPFCKNSPRGVEWCAQLVVDDVVTSARVVETTRRRTRSTSIRTRRPNVEECADTGEINEWDSSSESDPNDGWRTHTKLLECVYSVYVESGFVREECVCAFGCVCL